MSKSRFEGSAIKVLVFGDIWLTDFKILGQSFKEKFKKSDQKFNKKGGGQKKWGGVKIAEGPKC